MGALLTRASSEQSLLDAWEVVRDSAYDSGEPSPAIEDFEAKAASRISEISDMLQAGEWKPSPVFHVSIAKRSGGVRHLGIPNVEDRIVERAILGELDPMIDPLLMPWSYGYRRGLGADDAIRSLIEARDAGANWAVRVDIKDCFDSIPRWPLIKRLNEVCDDRELVELVRGLVYRHVVGKDKRHTSRANGLHQGSPLSPMLANLYLDAFDRSLAEQGYQVIRFADDIAIPVRDRARGEIAIQAARTAAVDIDLQLNVDKSRVVSFDQGIEFLGQTTTASSGAGQADMAHPIETTFYVTHQGALVRAKGERLVVTDGDTVLARANFRRIRQIVLMGRIGVTTPLIHRVLERGIEVIITDENGEYIGRFSSQERVLPHVRLQQYQASTDKDSVLRLARGFVVGKIQNLRVMLLRLDRRMQEPLLGPEIRRADKARTLALEATTLETLRGAEGAASREYFQAVGKFLDPKWGWEGRVRRPPIDPVNAMLSFGYTLLGNEGVTAAETAGLDPHIGFLHQTMKGRVSLAFDLIEEFRPVVVDSAVFALIGRGQLKPHDFEYAPDGACRMTAATRNLFITAYEKRMLTLMTFQDTKRRVSLRTALHLQAKAVADALDGDEPYRPVLWK